LDLAISVESRKRNDEAAIDRLQALLAEDLEKVNALIVEGMQSPVGLIPELASHIIASGGKRLRPLVTLAAARLCGYQALHHIRLAATVEFIHTATLLHDDVIDASLLRRGRATANTVWGNQSSVLVGDFLFSRAFQLMVEVGSLDILRVLSNAAAVIAEGEVLQLVSAHNLGTDETTYMSVIEAKTAALFAAAARIGAMVAGRSESEARTLESFGRDLGVAYQLVDDVLDYVGREALLGKAVGDDFREGKITLPVVLANRRGSDEERAFWQRTLVHGTQTASDFAAARRILERHHAIDDTMVQARRYVRRAGEALATFPDNIYQRALADLLDFTVERAY
jgi:octaprenyl-diphosphate synthase